MNPAQSGTLRIVESGSEVRLSWPYGPAYFSQAVPAQRRMFRIVIPFVCLFFVGMSIFVISIPFRTCEHGHPGVDGATWQGRLAMPILLGGVVALMLEMAAMFAWLLFGRWYARVRSDGITVYMRGLFAGLGRKFDARTTRVVESSINGMRHLVLRDGSHPATVGLGLRDDELTEMRDRFAQVLSIPSDNQTNEPPPRFTVEDFGEGSRIKIEPVKPALPVPMWKLMLRMMVPPMLLIVLGLWMIDWASKNDAVYIAHKKESEPLRALQRNDEDSTFKFIQMSVVMVVGFTSIYQMRRLRSGSVIELTPNRASIGSGRSAKRVDREETGAVVIGDAPYPMVCMRSVVISGRQGSTPIPGAFSREEARWLARWIRERWPHVDIREAATVTNPLDVN